MNDVIKINKNRTWLRFKDEVKKLHKIRIYNRPVLTTEQFACCLGTSINNIRQIHHRDRNGKYIGEPMMTAGIHYFLIKGYELKQLKDLLNDNRVTESNSVQKNAKSVLLWTVEALPIFSKIIFTKKSWQIYRILTSSYFRQKKNWKHKVSPEIEQESIQSRKQFVNIVSQRYGVPIGEATRLVYIALFNSPFIRKDYLDRDQILRLMKLEKGISERPVEDAGIEAFRDTVEKLKMK